MLRLVNLSVPSLCLLFQLAVQYFVEQKVAVVQLCDSFVGVWAKRVS